MTKTSPTVGRSHLRESTEESFEHSLGGMAAEAEFCTSEVSPKPGAHDLQVAGLLLTDPSRFAAEAADSMASGSRGQC